MAAPLEPSSVSDRVALELGAAIQSYSTENQFFDLAQGLLGIGAGGPVTARLYRLLQTNSDPEIEFVGLAGLVTMGDRSALAEIAKNVDRLSQLKVSGLVSAKIRPVRDTDAGAIESLGLISTSRNRNLQRAAASALEAIHTQRTLPYLAGLLDSTDAMAREDAIRGMSRFVDNLPVECCTNLPGTLLISQGPTPYRTAETDKYSLSRRLLGQSGDSEFVQFWKSWWAAMKNRLSPVNR
jgi:hypothetical protein